MCCPKYVNCDSRLSVSIKAGVELNLSRIQSLVFLFGTGSLAFCVVHAKLLHTFNLLSE